MRHDFIRCRPVTAALLVTLLMGTAVHAQDVEAQPTAQQPAPPGDKPAVLSPPVAPPSGAPAVMANVKADITITDQAGTTKPIVKTVSVVVADRANNQIRSSVNLPVATRRRIPARDSRTGEEVVDANWEMKELPLNIDVRAEVLDATRVRVRLVLNYRTATESTTLDGQPPRTSVVTEEVSTILENGKPTIISQSADAATDRKVTVEMKATIQR